MVGRMSDLDVCKYCHQVIEQSSDETWWLAGTCGNECPENPGADEEGFRSHSPRMPDLDDLEEVVQWLEQ